MVPINAYLQNEQTMQQHQKKANPAWTFLHAKVLQGFASAFYYPSPFLSNLPCDLLFQSYRNKRYFENDNIQLHFAKLMLLNALIGATFF